jgi:hypothetical protein
MFPNLKRENLKEHVYSKENLPSVMKMAAVYGANGAGKSNLYKAFEFLKLFFSALNNNFNIKEWYTKNRFMLPLREDNPPIAFIIEFEKKGKVYILNLEIDEKGIKKEELLLSGIGVNDNTPIYSRSYDKIQFLSFSVSRPIKEIIERQLTSFWNCSFLTLNGNLRIVNKSDLIEPYEWFKNDVLPLSYFRNIPQLIDLLSKDQGLMSFTNMVFSNIGLGLESLDVRKKTFEEWYADLSDGEKRLFNEGKLKVENDISLTKMQGDRPIASITNEEGFKIVKELLFRQYGKDGFVGEMDVSTQSNGTIKLLILMPALYKMLKEDVLIVVDEMDNCLHPKLLKGLIKIIGDKPTKGQLIFTTHEDYLLDQYKILRPDEIWIVDKVGGSSQFYSLNEFKLHKTLSIRKGYMDDRFGGTPLINFQAFFS